MSHYEPIKFWFEPLVDDALIERLQMYNAICEVASREPNSQDLIVRYVRKAVLLLD